MSTKLANILEERFDPRKFESNFDLVVRNKIRTEIDKNKKPQKEPSGGTHFLNLRKQLAANSRAIARSLIPPPQTESFNFLQGDEPFQ